MQLYIPSIFAVLLAIIVIIGIIPRMSPIIIVSLSIIALVYTANNHYKMFKEEYASISIGNALTAISPFLIVGAVLFFILGYLLYLINRNNTPSLPAVEPAPSSQSATNPLTYAVSNVLNMTKTLNTKAPNTTKTANNQNALLSAIKRV
jgi:large-conductance mechanosensitive channel